MTSRVARVLEARGLLDRRPDGQDLRAKRIVPTRAGAELAVRAIDVVEEAGERFFTATPERAGLLTLLRALREAPARDPATDRAGFAGKLVEAIL